MFLYSISGKVLQHPRQDPFALPQSRGISARFTVETSSTSGIPPHEPIQPKARCLLSAQLEHECTKHLKLLIHHIKSSSRIYLTNNDQLAASSRALDILREAPEHLQECRCYFFGPVELKKMRWNPSGFKSYKAQPINCKSKQ
jgi:hypothetical protein